jgi:hypothetical protein
MRFKNNIFNNSLSILMIFLFFVFIQKNSIFKKLYNLSNTGLNKRLISVYGYCGKSSYGFLNEVKKNYTLKENPNIIDYQIRPDSSWAIFDTSKNTSKKINVILNYKKELNLEFYKKDNLFVGKKNIEHTSGIESINIRVNKPIKINNLVQIYKTKDNNKILIFEKIINKKIDKQITVNLDYETNLINDRWAKIFINVINLENKYFKQINSIDLKLTNKYKIKEKDIIFNRENCFYIK